MISRALAEELRVVPRLPVPEHPVRHRLQRERTQAVAARDRSGREVDTHVLEVDHRPRRVRQVVHVDEREPEVPRHPAHGVVRERAAGVADDGEEPVRLPLEGGDVVVLLAQPQAQLGVRAPRLLRCRDRLRRAAAELAVQADDRLEHVLRQRPARLHRRQLQVPVERVALVAHELHLQRGARVRRLVGEQVLHGGAERGGQHVELRQPWLAPPVLEHRQLARRDAHLRAQLVEGEVRGSSASAEVPCRPARSPFRSRLVKKMRSSAP